MNTTELSALTELASVDGSDTTLCFDADRAMPVARPVPRAFVGAAEARAVDGARRERGGGATSASLSELES